MTFIDHIRRCNTHDLSRFLPFEIAGHRVGWVQKEFIVRLEAFPDLFRIAPDHVALFPDPGSPEGRTRAMDRVLRSLAAEGLIEGWRDEAYPVVPRFGAPELMSIERAAVPRFGISAYGIHVNGYVREAEAVKLWVGKRATDRLVAPGKLDNLVAGGQPSGLSLEENLIKECAEEADIGPDLARRAVPVGMVSYVMETEAGLKPDILFCYDLELPPAFRPRNTDGEMSGFELMPAAQVMERVRSSDDFKFNVNLVLIDFFIRHGMIGPQDPDYVELARGLRLWARPYRP